MKKLTIALILLAVIFIIGCQAPQEIKTQLDKQTQTIETLQKTVNEQAAKIEQLKMDYEKHMIDLHKKTVPTQIKPTTLPPPKSK